MDSLFDSINNLNAIPDDENLSKFFFIFLTFI